MLSSLVLSIVLLTSCYTGLEREPIPHVQFDLPPGWEEIHNDPGYVAIGKEVSADVGVPHYKLETIPRKTFQGGREDAYGLIHQYYDHMIRPGAQGDEKPVLEVDLPSGASVFADISPAVYWGEGGYATIFAFEKNGYVISMYLNDDIENHIEAVDIIVKSATVTLK